MATYPACACCRRLMTRPGHRVREFGGGRRELVFCRVCAAHWSAKADGTVYVPVCCPDNPRPALRIGHGQGPGGR